ncbi:hypothetical protein [Bradyrhizobium sp. th.b2]|uniref:hypothetical protein n=1 Tax=Bradyrhizobium sp. th-b2 TaxID=172088 RepID=UPI0003F7E9CA|nr:hypothetical protein [Bradyrhizobium sp. th.b2]
MDRSFAGDRGISEAIDALYRASAAPRDHERLINLVQVQVRHAYSLGYRAGKRKCRNEPDDANQTENENAAAG